MGGHETYTPFLLDLDMTQEEKQLLYKDISARLFYGVKAEARGWDEEKEEEVLVPVTVYSVNTDGYVYFADNDYDITYCSIDACRLYLRPMSSMTEEEKENFWCPIHLGGLVTHADTVKCMDWLNEHHFDFRNLIEKGLAIEAPDNMYKTDLNMAKKYIDADLLKKEVESRMGDCDANSKNPNQLLWAELAALIPFIDSLQKEQSCDTCTNDKGCVTCKDGELWEGKEQPSEDLEDLNAEIEMEWDSFNKHLAEYDDESEDVVWLNWNSFEDTARHFYELGKQSKEGELTMAEEVKVKGWVARDEDGTMTLFRDKPIRYGDYWSSKNRYPEDATFGPLTLNAFLALKWEDEPVEVELIVKKL